MGPKSFEQCAGFLKIPESGEALDNTWVHPENYPLAREIQKNLTTTSNLASNVISELKEKFGVGDMTITDIVDELKKPNRDPREGYPKPIMQKGVLHFEDLKEGMMVTGKIKNVVDFGAFVDLGIKETALVHISEMSDHFVKDPMDEVKVGDVMEFRIISLDQDRRRIGLSRKSGQPAAASDARAGGPAPHSRSVGAAHSETGHSGGKRVVVRTGAGAHAGAGASRPEQGRAGGTRGNAPHTTYDDDKGTYNAFAEAFRKAQERSKEKKR
jgi:uncharacterized protein